MHLNLDAKPNAVSLSKDITMAQFPNYKEELFFIPLKFDSRGVHDDKNSYIASCVYVSPVRSTAFCPTQGG